MAWRTRVALGLSLVLLATLLPQGILAIGPGRATEYETGGRRTLDEFIDFREQFGLNTDREYVASVTGYSPDYGLPLTRDEVADLLDRGRIQESLGPLREFAASMPAGFGGLYIDQAAGGEIDIAVTAQASAAEVERLLSLVPSGARARVRTVARSLAELVQLQAEVDGLEASGRRLARSTYIDVRSNVIVVGVDALDPLSLLLRLAPRDVQAVRIDDPVITVEAACNNRGDCVPYRAGLEVYRSGAACTGAFMAQTASGNHLWMTAGHCGGINSVWFHNEAQLGKITRRAYADGGSADAAAINVPGSQHNWLYVTSGEMSRTVTSREGHNADGGGDQVCQSGKTTGLFCGLIYQTDVHVQPSAGFDLFHMRLASIHPAPGDSGGPVFYGHKAKGIVHGVTPGLFCGQFECGVYTHIWEAENALDVTVLTD